MPEHFMPFVQGLSKHVVVVVVVGISSASAASRSDRALAGMEKD